MADPISDLRAAGFGDDEIGAWATDKRKTLFDAGFKDNEIDSYFVGGPVVPDGVPPAMEARLNAGQEARKREGGLLQTVPHFADMMSSPDGRTKLWDSVKKYPGEFISGMVDQVKVPGEVAKGNLDLNTPEGMDQAIGLGALVGLGRLNKLSATGKTSGLAVATGDHVARIDRGPMGEIRDLPIGGLPKSEDFVSTAKSIAGDETPPLVQEKLVTLYQEHGIHPAEVAHDAATNPVIMQKLLSSDKADLPYITAYHGSPHSFDAFSMDKVGTGEGAQAYGHGLYFAENEGVARQYRAKLASVDATANQFLQRAGGDVEKALAEWDASVAKSTYELSAGERASLAKTRENIANNSAAGSLYQIKLSATPENLLDWDAPLKEQAPKVQAALKEVMANSPEAHWFEWRGDNLTGKEIYDMLGNNDGKVDQVRSSQLLKDAGVSGIRYLDQGSRTSVDTNNIRGSLSVWESGLAKTPNDPYAQQQVASLREQLSKAESAGTRNLVVFDDKLVEITHKNGEPVTKAERQEYLAERMGGGDGHSSVMAADAKNADVIKSDVVAEGGGKPPAPPSVPSVGGGEGGKPPMPDAQKAISDKISVGARDPQAKVTLDKLYTEAVDSLHPLKGVDGDAYQLARLTRGQFAKAQHFLEHGTFEFNTYKNNGRPLKDILEPVRNDLDGLRTYLASKRAVDIEASGRKSGMDLEAAKKVAADGAGKYEDIAAQIGQYQDNLLTYLKDSGVLSDAAYTAMREANKNYVPFFRLMGTGEKRGVGKGFGPGNPVKRLEGSDRSIIDPLESIIKNTYAYVSVAERNAVGIKLIDTLKKTGSEVSTSKLPAKDADLSKYLSENGVKSPDDLAAFVRDMAGDGETISAYRNGVKESVKVDDPELVRAFRGLDTQNLDMLIRVLAVPAKTLRAGAVLTPEFMARNIVNDFITAFVNTKGAIFSPIDTVKGLNSVIRKDADFQNWLKSGGANATLVSLDRRYLQESLQKLTGETGLGDRAWNVVKSPLTGLRMLSELTENATRLGEFKKILGESVAKEDIQAAGFSSREVTLDFARIGASMRSYNAITAFANAQLQGTDRLVRAFKDNPVQTSARIAAGITIPSMLLWWANHDDPRYKELPAWQKDLNWIVLTDKWEEVSPSQAAMRPEHSRRQVGDKWYVNNGHTFRIPKGHAIGVLFGSGAERALDATIGDNPEAFAHYGKSLMASFLPNFIPTIGAGIVEQFANRSTFSDRTLIPSSMEKFLPEYQYTEYTTETSKALGSLIASFPGIREASVDDGAGIFGAAARSATSPILMENYLRSWTGGLGMHALNLVDTTLRKSGVLPDPIKPEATLADIPFVKAFVIRYPSASAQSIQDFYDGHERSKKYFDTWMSKAKEGDAAAMANIQAAGGPMMFARLDGIQKVLSEHSKLVRDIYKDPTMPGPEKRQLIDQLYNSMIGIAGSGKQMMKQIESAQ